MFKKFGQWVGYICGTIIVACMTSFIVAATIAVIRRMLFVNL